jgi:glyoxylase-like metal-dependent hydrolase (beta-lactamase superfamily II)
MRADVRQVADGTYLVHGSNTNWVILTEGDAVTLIDTGYSGVFLFVSLAASWSKPLLRLPQWMLLLPVALLAAAGAA